MVALQVREQEQDDTASDEESPQVDTIYKLPGAAFSCNLLRQVQPRGVSARHILTG